MAQELSALARSLTEMPTTREFFRTCRAGSRPGEARKKRIRHALSNSFGFGGSNVALIFGPPR
jgi:3-oxoacyl-(acyl-carrier-protein) synthase